MKPISAVIIVIVMIAAFSWSSVESAKAQNPVQHESATWRTDEVLLAASEDANWQQDLEAELEKELSEETDMDPDEEKDADITEGKEQVFEEVDCEQDYLEIMDENGADFSECYGKIEGSGCGQDGSPQATLPINLVVIMDSSGSMAARVQGETRMAIAKKAATAFLNGLKQDINLALMIYGHKGSNKKKDKKISCEGIETIIELQKINPPQVGAVINNLRPVGYTPLATSLHQADSILTDYPADKFRNIVILISDGKETCGGDPVSRAQQLNDSVSHGIINVIGLDVGGEVEKQLHSIAAAGKGKYYSARTSKELNTVLANLAKQECAMDANEKALEAFLSVELNMMDCKNKLIYEKNAALLEVVLIDNPICKRYTYDRYRERFFSIKKRLGEIYYQGMAKSKQSFGDKAETGEYQQFFNNGGKNFPPLREIDK